jgi:hypothetical protein
MRVIKTPVRNVRRVDPRCCMTCAYLKFDGDGMAFCRRPNGPEWDVADQMYLYTVCNMWRSQLYSPLPEEAP